MPNALMVPEVHLMLSIAQREINNKNSVTILTCGGGKNFACSKNIYGIKAICKSCLFQQDNLVKKLNGKFVLKKISDQQKINSKVNIKKIKNYKYKNTNLGLAAFSSYTNTSRDTYLKGAIAQNSINKLVDLLGGEKIHIPKRPGEPDCTYADISKIKSELNWIPKVSIEEGVKLVLQNIEYWRNAPVWTPDTIANETEDWFKYLGKK